MSARLIGRGIAAVLVLLLLAACDNEEPTPKATPRKIYVTATPDVAPTVIVTLPPTNTPAPTPTLNYNLVPVGGDWALRMDVTIEGGDYTDRLSYSAIALLHVETDGTINGTGEFWPTIWDEECLARVLDEEPLAFTVQGTTRPEGDQVWASLELKPDNMTRRENYELTCPNFNDVRTRYEAILWPVLQGLGRLAWDVPLVSGERLAFTSDLTADLRGAYSGQLVAEFSLGRN